jgi:hypothetical protein
MVSGAAKILLARTGFSVDVSWPTSNLLDELNLNEKDVLFTTYNVRGLYTLVLHVLRTYIRKSRFQAETPLLDPGYEHPDAIS